MAKEWNFLQELVFNFGSELASNPTQYMMEQAFAREGLNWRYVQFEFSPEKLASAVAAMRLLGFRGGNCTMPYKVAIVEHLDGLGESAAVMGAVNCVVRREDRLIGENTDGKGFLQSFREVAEPKGRSVVVLGAGGAARAIAVELALAGASRFTIVNRTAARGKELTSLLTGKVGVEASYVPWEKRLRRPRHGRGARQRHFNRHGRSQCQSGYRSRFAAVGSGRGRCDRAPSRYLAHSQCQRTGRKGDRWPRHGRQPGGDRL